MKEKDIIKRVKNETKIFSNISFIFQKIEVDGYYKIMFETFNNIFKNEMEFAILELQKIYNNKPLSDFKNLIINNTYIFKENLKIITTNLVDEIWKDYINNDYIDLFKSSKLNNNISEIKEEDEFLLSSNYQSRDSKNNYLNELKENIVYSNKSNFKEEYDKKNNIKKEKKSIKLNKKKKLNKKSNIGKKKFSFDFDIKKVSNGFNKNIANITLDSIKKNYLENFKNSFTKNKNKININ